MTHDDIQKEWDLFIEYPEGSDKLYVTTTSALLFARAIAEMAAAAEREACARIADAELAMFGPGAPVTQYQSGIFTAAEHIAEAIRAMGQP